MALSISSGCDGIYLSKSTASKLADESVKWEDRKPIGIRFKPSDEALARIFIGKAFGRTDNIVSKFIKEINVYEREPWDLSGSAHPFGEGKMYFFTYIDKKYSEGKTIKREVSKAGLWKKTGAFSSIRAMPDDKKLSVKKTSLAFYKKIGGKSGQPEKTPWLMKEYTLDCKNTEKKLLALCVIYRKVDDKQQKLGKSSENESRDGTIEQSSMPAPDHLEVGSSQVATITASSSFLFPTQNSNPACQQYPNFLVSNPQLYLPSNNPGTTYPNVYSNPNIYNQSSFPEPVPNDSVLNNLLVEPEPDPHEYSNSSVVPASNITIGNTNLFDQDGCLDPYRDSVLHFNCSPRSLSPDYFAELLSKDDRFQHFDNYEHGSNQQQPESSHVPIDQIIKQPIDSAMTWSPTEQQPFVMTPIAARPFYQSPLIANVSDGPNDQITQQASNSVMAGNLREQQPAGMTSMAAQPFRHPFLVVNNGLLQDIDCAMTWNQSRQQAAEIGPILHFPTIEEQWSLCEYEPMEGISEF